MTLRQKEDRDSSYGSTGASGVVSPPLTVEQVTLIQSSYAAILAQKGETEEGEMLTGLKEVTLMFFAAIESEHIATRALMLQLNSYGRLHVISRILHMTASMAAEPSSTLLLLIVASSHASSYPYRPETPLLSLRGVWRVVIRFLSLHEGVN